MNLTLWKTAYREILRSPGRFFAIMGIIMLGSGFFVGLRVTYDAMVKTGSDFLAEASFYDFALSSTMGYTESEVDAIRSDPSVIAAEGCVRTDALVSGLGGEDSVIAFMTYTTEVNAPRITKGRAPEAPGELVLDNRLAGFGTDENGAVRLTLSDMNDADTLDMFAAEGFTVVGYAASPMYLNYERGSTSIGSGSVTAFAYVSPATFDVDYYTTVYVKTTGAAAYTDEYDADTDSAEPEITALAEKEAKARLEGIVREAREKLDDGEREYADGLREFTDKKTDAERELADAAEELADAKTQIEDGRRELEDGKKELEEQRESGLTQITDGRAELEKGLAELRDGERQLREARQQLADAKAQYENGLAEYNAAMENYGELVELYDAVVSISGEESLTDRVEAYLVERFGEDSRIVEAYRNYVNRIAGLGEEIPGENGLSGLVGSTLGRITDSLEELRSARQQLDDAKAQIEEGEKKIADSRYELDVHWEEYHDAVSKLDEGEREYWEGIADAERQLADAETELSDGEKQYEDGLKEYADAKEEFDSGIADAERELADARQELDDGWAELDKLEEPQVFVLGRWANIGYSCFESDASIVANVAKVFPVFFFLVAALICMTTVSRMVDEQRAQLGVLMALGYSRASVMAKYLIYSGSATVIGCAGGILLFSWLFPNMIWQAYSIMYDFSPRLEFYINWPLSIITFVAYVAAMLLVTYLSLRSQLADTPANIIRPKPPKAGKRVLLERLPFIWNRLGFMRKVTLRNIFRYKERVLMMVLGIGGCTALMITGFGIRDSIQNIVDYQYDDITVYDYDAAFMDPVDEEGAERFITSVEGYAGSAALISQENVDAAFGHTAKTAYLTAFRDEDTAGDYFVLRRDGEAVDFPKSGEAVINFGLADAIGAKTGDTLTVTADGAEAELVISGIFDNYIYNYVIVTKDTLRASFGTEPEWKTALIIASGPEDITAKLLAEDGVINVTAGSVLRERIGGIMDNLIYIVLLTIICAAALAFIVIYNLTNININERMREIATVKVLGFYPAEAAVYVLRENVLLTVLGALLGIPLGIALNTFVVNTIKVDLVSFIPRVLPQSFLYSIALTMLFSVIVDLVMSVKLNRIDMAAALKAAE